MDARGASLRLRNIVKSTTEVLPLGQPSEICRDVIGRRVVWIREWLYE